MSKRHPEEDIQRVVVSHLSGDRPTRKLVSSKTQDALGQWGCAMMRAALAKPRRSDRASVAFRRAVDRRTDCSRSAGSVHPAEERSRPTALRQDKSREVRPGRAVEELNQINHFARAAFRHRTSSLRPISWNAKASRTLLWGVVARRTLRPFHESSPACDISDGPS
jgi:hypothetical protein